MKTVKSILKIIILLGLIFVIGYMVYTGKAVSL